MAHTKSSKGTLLRLLDDIARLNGLSISNAESHVRILESASDAIRAVAHNPIANYGFRTEYMFAYVAAALGNCKLINSEDSDFGFHSDSISPPDYRIVTKDDHAFLVEVKNHFSTSVDSKVRLKKDYVDKLLGYARLTRTPLKFAIYWARLGLWTLNAAEHLQFYDGIAQLSMPVAFKQSEMNLLRDYWVGTTPPMSFRVYADPTMPRTIRPDGTVHFTCERASLCVNGTDVVDEFEQRLAWFFMVNGTWNETETREFASGGELDYFEVAQRPERYERNERFALLGFMSQMISTQYRRATSFNGTVTNLRPNFEPAKLGVIIPDGFTGEAMPLWIFRQVPNLDDLKPEQRRRHDSSLPFGPAKNPH